MQCRCYSCIRNKMTIWNISSVGGDEGIRLHVVQKKTFVSLVIESKIRFTSQVVHNKRRKCPATQYRRTKSYRWCYDSYIIYSAIIQLIIVEQVLILTPANNSILLKI